MSTELMPAPAPTTPHPRSEGNGAAASGNGLMNGVGGDRIFALAQRAANPLEFMAELGKSVAQSGMLGVKTPAQGQTLLLACVCENKTPFQLMREYHVMEDGKLTQRADAMLAKFRAMGGEYKIVQRDDGGAAIELTFRGNTEKFSLSWEEAQLEPFVWNKKGELKINYATPRARMQMMWARVVSDGVGTLAPEVRAGLYTPEEMQDADDDVGRLPATAAEPKRRTTTKAIESTATTNTGAMSSPATSTPVADAVIDAQVEQPVANATTATVAATESTSTKPTSDASTANTLQANLMEIELALSQLGMTKADLIGALQRKTDPSIKSLDDLSPERAQSIVENLRAQLAKKQASQTA